MFIIIPSEFYNKWRQIVCSAYFWYINNHAEHVLTLRTEFHWIGIHRIHIELKRALRRECIFIQA